MRRHELLEKKNASEHPDGPLVESGSNWEIRKPTGKYYATLIKKAGRTHVDWHDSLEEARRFVKTKY